MPSYPNAFESGERKIIPAVLVYVQCQSQVLMIHRNTNPGDHHQGKWNGLGGKCEADESPREAARRETLEESGLDLPESDFLPMGVLQFPNFKPQKAEDWIVFLFTVKIPPEKLHAVLKKIPEGELHWVQATDVLSLNLWPGDRLFISHVLSQTPILGTIWYHQGEVTRHWIQPFTFSSTDSLPPSSGRDNPRG